jgi:hypothetical protein
MLAKQIAQVYIANSAAALSSSTSPSHCVALWLNITSNMLGIREFVSNAT